MPTNSLQSITSETPVLYSFRRCPYAMRARMVLLASGQKIELRDVLLKDKPAHMIAMSPKATVPVLILETGQVLEESLDIMMWAILANDPLNLYPADSAAQNAINILIAENDGPFKTSLDRYKYHIRFPESSRDEYRAEGEKFLQKLETLLKSQTYLMGEDASLADMAIFPFIRQFANSDRDWFDKADYPALQKWLRYWVSSESYLHIMKKRPIWSDDVVPCYFPDLILVDGK
ncbi:MAG: glutathione S-transferase [Sneathiella sp.]|nr:glutathione S-transferase [Sneathiella sp.]